MRTTFEEREVLCRQMVSPVGDLAPFADDESLFAVEFLRKGDQLVIGDGDDNAVLGEARRQLDAYFAGRLRDFDLPLQPVGTEFQCAVWQVMRQIPYGGVMTYGELAEAVGDRKKARAVGHAANRNPLAIVIPCHRVIGSNGRLVGYGGGLDHKAFLLGLESGGREWRATLLPGLGSTGLVHDE